MSMQPSPTQKNNADEKFTRERVLSVRRWSDTLFSFTLTRPAGFKFTAGQFARIGIEIVNDDGEEERIFRAYSVVSSPFATELEFFSIVVPDGAFTSRLKDMKVDDDVLVEKIPYGFLTLARYQEPVPTDLWLLATGTGLAPFLSILQAFDVWQQYERIVLVYSARTVEELAYLELIGSLKDTFGMDENGKGAEFEFVPIVTREPCDLPNAMSERIPKLLLDGRLQSQINQTLNPDTSHVMLCGNPQMIDDTKEALKSLGLSMNRRGVGNIAVENYW